MPTHWAPWRTDNRRHRGGLDGLAAGDRRGVLELWFVDVVVIGSDLGKEVAEKPVADVLILEWQPAKHLDVDPA